MLAKYAWLAVYIALTPTQGNFLALAGDKAPLLGQRHASVLRSHRGGRLLCRCRCVVTMMFISCQMLLILLETVRCVPDRLTRLVGEAVDTLGRSFCHESIQADGYRLSCICPRGSPLTKDSMELLVLVPSLYG